jgi:hypothetical protein
VEELPAMQVLYKHDCDEGSARETYVDGVLGVLGLRVSKGDIILKEHESIITHDCATEREKDNACDPGGDVTAPWYGLSSRYGDEDNRNPDLGHLHALERKAGALECYICYLSWAR